jgi:hypothetical protein
MNATVDDGAGPRPLRVVPRINPQYPFHRPPELDGARDVHPVVVVGAGPVGLVAAVDLAQRGVPVVVLDDDCTVSVGSRAICHAKRTLEILDRLGCGEALVQKGVQWHVGRVFFGAAPAYQFDLLPRPAIAARHSSTCSSTTSRSAWSSAPCSFAPTCAGAAGWWASTAARTP